MNEEQFIRYLRYKMMRHAGGNQKEFAIMLGISPQYLNDLLTRKRKPGFKIQYALGFVRVEGYIPTGEKGHWKNLNLIDNLMMPRILPVRAGDFV